MSEAGEVYIGCYDQTSEVLASHVYRLGDGEWEAIGEPHGLEAIADLAMDRPGACGWWAASTAATWPGSTAIA